MHERINILVELLLDKDSFCECTYCKKEDEFPNSVFIGEGTIEEKKVCIIIQDFTYMGGSIGEIEANKILYIQKHALEINAPIIILCNSGGARIQEGVKALNGMGEILKQCHKIKGNIPQIAIVLGTCAGGVALWATMCDFVFMIYMKSRMFITGPKVIENVTGEKISQNELGGTDIHLTKSGVAHFGYKDEKECIQNVKKLLEYITGNHSKWALKKMKIFKKQYIQKSELEKIIPRNQKMIYDMNIFINLLVDKNSFLEVQKDYATNAIIGFAKINNKVIAIIANQPMILCGSIDIEAAKKITRFVCECNSYKIPILVLVDTPGFYPSGEQEKKGVLKEGVNMMNAFIMSNVKKITVILRKAFGGAYIAMNSKSIGADIVYAWPNAKIGTIGNSNEKMFLDKTNKNNIYGIDKEDSLELAIKRGYITEIIRPEETRKKIFENLLGKRNR